MTKTLELPEDLFERLEAYRRARKLSRVAALDELLPRAGQADDLWLQRLLESAPVDDEPLSEETRRALDRAKAEIARGEVETLAEYKARRSKNKTSE